MKNENTSEREIVISKVVDAPRELVFKAWTELEHLKNWWGPNGFSTKTEHFEFRIGGEWIFLMIGPDGHEFPNEIYFENIIPPELIEYEHGGGDEVGVNDAAFHATITFEEQGEKTLITMKSLFLTKKQRDHVVEKYGAIEGGKQHLASLEEYVKLINSNE